MKTRSRSRIAQQKGKQDGAVPEENTDKESADEFSDSELDDLVHFAVDHMKKAYLEEKKSEDSEIKAKTFAEDFVTLDSGKEEEDIGTNVSLVKNPSLLKTASVSREERIPQGLESGFEKELQTSEEDTVDRGHELQMLLAKSAQDKLLEKSVLKPDLEKQHAIPPYSVSKKQQWKERKKIRDASAGEGWFNMKEAEMTPELENDLKAIQMRSILDPKRFYKKNDMKTLPKFVQVGTVMDSAADFHHARVSRKDRRQTIVDELLADAEMRRYNKKKYMELQIRRSSSKRRRRMKHVM